MLQLCCAVRSVLHLCCAALHCTSCTCHSIPFLLQVDYTGFTTINTQRFGQRFVGRVANPNDIILWQKALVRKTKASYRSRD